MRSAWELAILAYKRRGEGGDEQRSRARLVVPGQYRCAIAGVCPRVERAVRSRGVCCLSADAIYTNAQPVVNVAAAGYVRVTRLSFCVAVTVVGVAKAVV